LGRELAGVVGRAHAAKHALAAHRRDVDDVPRLLREHRRQDRLARVEDAEQVHLHEPVEVLRARVRERLEHAVARVVDQDVDAPVAGERPGDQPLDRGLVRHVGDEVLDLGARGARLLADLRELPLAARRQHEPRAGAREGERRHPADAARSARNQHDFLFEAGHDSVSS
jgi:hypothetical protein